MKLQFADGTELEVLRVMGGPQMIQNASRDVLTIEIAPDTAGLDALKALFTDREKTKSIKSVESGPDGETVNLIGEHYTMYLSARNEFRERPATSGTVAAPEKEEINIVKIAQLTYTELMLEKLLGAQAGAV